MKRSILSVIFTICIMFFAIAGIYAEEVTETPNESYNKTFSVGVDPLGFILLGPTIQIEYSGFGAIGLYGAYQNVGLGALTKSYEEDQDVKITGYAFETGLRYYLNYASSYHDSYYISTSYMNMYLKAEEVDLEENNLDLRAHSGILSFGRRWQWSLIYLDLSFGVAYTETSATVSKYYDKQDKEDLENSIDGFGYQLKFLVGMAF